MTSGTFSRSSYVAGRSSGGIRGMASIIHRRLARSEAERPRSKNGRRSGSGRRRGAESAPAGGDPRRRSGDGRGSVDEFRPAGGSDPGDPPGLFGLCGPGRVRPPPRRRASRGRDADRGSHRSSSCRPRLMPERTSIATTGTPPTSASSPRALARSAGARAAVQRSCVPRNR
jgi:hypothetical protein